MYRLFVNTVTFHLRPQSSSTLRLVAFSNIIKTAFTSDKSNSHRTRWKHEYPAPKPSGPARIPLPLRIEKERIPMNAVYILLYYNIISRLKISERRESTNCGNKSFCTQNKRVTSETRAYQSLTTFMLTQFEK